jgi:glutamine amidotransferase
MCRHLAWLGRRRTLAELVLEPPSWLLVQSWAPRRQRHGAVNAGGWGVGFSASGRAQPARWRSARPLCAEPSFASVAPVVSSGCVLAAVRSATPGMPLEESAAAPFTDGRWLLSHNGRVHRAVLPPSREVESTCDSALPAALSILTTTEGTALASEPYDDDGRWRDVPDRHLVGVGPDGLSLTPLEEPA